jgi:hypothetical protein
MNKELAEFLEHCKRRDEAHLFELRRFFTKNSQPVKGALALPIGTTDKAKTVLSNSAGRLLGWAVEESTGAAAAKVQLLDGTNIDGDLLAPISLAAGADSTQWFGPAGISFGTGLFASLVSGSVIGTVWLGGVDI